MSQLSSRPSAANDVCTITAGPMDPDTKHSLIFPVPLDRVQWLSPITYAPVAVAVAVAAAAAAAATVTACSSWCASSSSSIEFALIRPDPSPAPSSMITPLVSFINPAYAGLRKTYFIPEYIHKRVSYESVEKLFQTSTWLLVLEPIAIAIPTNNNSNTSSSSSCSSSSSSSYRVIGCLVLDVLSRPNPNPNNTLVGLATILAVSPDQRGTGIASRIMIAAHQYFKREGCTIIEMTVWWPESEANPFDYPSSPSSRLRIWYARLGFRTVMSRYVKDAFPERQAEFLDGIMEDTIQKTINTQTSADATTTAPTAGITLASL